MSKRLRYWRNSKKIRWLVEGARRRWWKDWVGICWGDLLGTEELWLFSERDGQPLEDSEQRHDVIFQTNHSATLIIGHKINRIHNSIQRNIWLHYWTSEHKWNQGRGHPGLLRALPNPHCWDQGLGRSLSSEARSDTVISGFIKTFFMRGDSHEINQ